MNVDKEHESLREEIKDLKWKLILLNNKFSGRTRHLDCKGIYSGPNMSGKLSTETTGEQNP